MIKVVIGQNEQNQRLDKFLRKYLENAPLSFIYKAIRKDIKVNGKRSKEETILSLGDEITLYIDDRDVEKFCRTKKRYTSKKQFKVAYEDENIIAVDKPFGLLTHGDKTEKKNHLTNQVIDYLIERNVYNPRLEKTFTPAPVNRLDRNTTGLVLFGKTNPALQQLNEMIREKDKISKHYLTIVVGKMDKELHLTDNMIKDTRTNKVTVLSSEGEGRLMETLAMPLQYAGGYTLVEVEIITGRTHQIRAHLAKAGYPVIGDSKYGNRKINQIIKKEFDWNTQLLHAYKLKFGECRGDLEYLSGKEIISEIPEDFSRIKNGIFGKNN